MTKTEQELYEMLNKLIDKNGCNMRDFYVELMMADINIEQVFATIAKILETN